MSQPAAQVYVLGDGGANAANVFDMRIGADGNLYYTTVPQISGTPYPTSGEIGQFDLNSRTQQYGTVRYAPGFIDETDAGVWVQEWNNATGNPTIDRYSAIGGKDTPISIPLSPFGPNSFGNGILGGVAVTGDGHVWFGSNNSGQIGVIDPMNDAVSVYTLQTPAGGQQPSPQFMVLGADKHIWVTDAGNDGVFRAAASGAHKGSSTFIQLPQGPVGPPNFPYVQGIGTAGDGRIYTGSEFAPPPYGQGALDAAFAVAAPRFEALNLPKAGLWPLLVAGSKNKVFFIDYHFEGVGIYDIASRRMVVLPTGVISTGAGLAIDSSGTAWASCITAAGQACIQRIGLPAKWQIYPSRALTLFFVDSFGDRKPPGLLGIGESGDSGPFTVVSSDQTICTAGMIPGFDHNIQVKPVQPGPCTVTVKDAHGRTARVSVTVVLKAGNTRMQVRGGAQIRPAHLPRTF